MRRTVLMYLAFAAALAILSGLSLTAGRVWVPWSAWTHSGDPRWAIIFDLRLPRTILGLMVGAVLGLAGAALQGYTRNPLADPGALGVSSMAAFGAVATLYFGAGAAAPWVISGAAMVMAFVGVVLLLAFAGVGSGLVTFVLSGVILQTLAAAGVALALSLAPNPWAVNEIIDWLMGSLADRSMDEVRFAAPFMAAGAALLLLTGRALDALTLGETTARSLGVNLRLTQVLLAIGLALTAGASVAVTGVISFVGLIVPHLVRPLVGGRPGALLLPSALAGAVLVLAADTLVRLTPGAHEVKLGVAMAALGAPFFFGLLVVLRRRLA